ARQGAAAGRERHHRRRPGWSRRLIFRRPTRRKPVSRDAGFFCDRQVGHTFAHGGQTSLSLSALRRHVENGALLPSGEMPMTPARDLLAKILMILLGLSAVGAFVGAVATIGDFAPD